MLRRTVLKLFGLGSLGLAGSAPGRKPTPDAMLPSGPWIRFKNIVLSVDTYYLDLISSDRCLGSLSVTGSFLQEAPVIGREWERIRLILSDPHGGPLSYSLRGTHSPAHLHSVMTTPLEDRAGPWNGKIQLCFYLCLPGVMD